MMTTTKQIGETARDRADFCGGFRQAPPYFCTMIGLLRIFLQKYLERCPTNLLLSKATVEFGMASFSPRDKF
jgi:hypothetical protein